MKNTLFDTLLEHKMIQLWNKWHFVENKTDYAENAVNNVVA